MSKCLKLLNLDRYQTLLRARETRDYLPDITGHQQVYVGTGELLSQSTDRRQSIFCISNVSDAVQPLDLSGVNLIDAEDWYDLLAGVPVEDTGGIIELAPYQTVWISNVAPWAPVNPASPSAPG